MSYRVIPGKDVALPLRCPICDTGIVVYGQHEPHVCDDDGKVYCRTHAPEKLPGYSSLLKEYKAWRAERQQSVAQSVAEWNDGEE